MANLQIALKEEQCTNKFKFILFSYLWKVPFTKLFLEEVYMDASALQPKLVTALYFKTVHTIAVFSNFSGLIAFILSIGIE